MENKGFFESLFDFEFNEYVTLKIVKWVFMLMIFLVSLFTVIFVIDGFGVSVFRGILYLIISPAIFLVLVTISRLFLELTVVIFKLSEDIEMLRKNIEDVTVTNKTDDSDNDIPIKNV